MNNMVPVVLAGCGCVAATIFTIAALTAKKRSKNKNTASERVSSPEPTDTTVTLTATVADMACWVETVGIRLPKTVKRFQILFETDGGEQLKLEVNEEMYGGFEKGQTGTLTLVDGELYGFRLTEEDT